MYRENYGMCFGKGCELYLSDSANAGAHNTIKIYGSYNLSTIENGLPKMLLEKSNSFQVEDIEIYSIS
jgi:hypothetical protein